MASGSPLLAPCSLHEWGSAGALGLVAAPTFADFDHDGDSVIDDLFCDPDGDGELNPLPEGRIIQFLQSR